MGAPEAGGVRQIGVGLSYNMPWVIEDQQAEIQALCEQKIGPDGLEGPPGPEIANAMPLTRCADGRRPRGADRFWAWLHSS